MSIEILANNQVQMIVLLIGIDAVLGIIAALMKKEFVLGKVASFMKRGVLVYVFGYAVISAVGEAIPSLAMVVTAAYWLIVLALIGSVLDNLGKIGLPIPKILRK
ncbi:MAG: phage holin family protein [Candidatus Nealsonbacteria bacterium]